MSLQKGQTIFPQGDASDAVFVVKTGLVTLSARLPRPQGAKETSGQAINDIFGQKDFVQRALCLTVDSERS
jgi:CRP-like cAMP-binding protein